MDAKLLKKILELHEKWLKSVDGGKRANLSGANLSWADLRRANLSWANLSDANLRRANLSGANLSDANLSGVNLSGANLSDANLSGADLSWADPSGADLSGANLRRANLSGANLSWADLRRANLSGADLDFSVWPLWCGSKSVQVDARIAAQLAAHFCALDCKDKGYMAARKAVLKFAKTSHRANDLGLLG